jgi:CubicO group peptidase (beta-lactamase class C family)
VPDQPASLFDLGLFTGVPQHENFGRLPDLLPHRTMPAAATRRPWPAGPAVPLPASYAHEGADRPLQDFLDATDTAALLALVDGEVRLEYHALTGGPDVPWISMSVAKSAVSALLGIAVAEKAIGSIDDPVSAYVPVEAGSAYDGVAIRDVLRMSSGARWVEDYSDPTSDIFRLGAAVTGPSTLDDFVATMVRDVPPGTLCRYNSGDTQALAAVLTRATGRSLTDYMHDRLCEPLGTVAPAHWLVDTTGTEMAFGGLLMTAGDFARLGELFRRGGEWAGEQLVPAEWVRDSVRSLGPTTEPGRPVVGTHAFDFGYGYQWWLPEGGRGEFSAIGVYNQFVYVDPARRTTIVKLSANRAYGTDETEQTNREVETVSMLRAVSAAAAS